MKKRYIALGLLGGLILIGMLMPEPEKAAAPVIEATDTVTDAPSVTASASTAVSPSASASATFDTAQDTLTAPQRNAVRSAEQYLSMQGFSRRGLIEQLSSDAGDGYPKADATIAVDSLEVDWNENAAKSAEQYLNMTGFSCKGLIEQLSSSAGDQYTVQQATYGAKQAGAC